MPGCEIHDDPLAPLCSACRAARGRARATTLPVAWLAREERYVEKLATPDVTIADMLGDIDPIKAARSGLQLGDDLTMHYGLLPRANRGIFAINELPDLAGKIQVGLFNILQEGDVQIKGYPVRLRLDVMMAFTANPEDYTARGKIITPLKDRIGSEIRTHYAATRHQAMAITAQEAWTRPPIGVPDRWRCRPTCARWSRRLRSRRAPSAASTSARASASGCRSRRSRTWRATRSGARILNREAPVARHGGRARGAAVDHGQVRAGVRRRAPRRRQPRARSDPRRRRQRVHRVLRERRRPIGRRVVRPRRRAAARRQRAVGAAARGRAAGARPARSGRHCRRRPEGVSASPRVGGDVHPRRASTRRRGSAAATIAATMPPSQPSPRRPRAQSEPSFDDMPQMPGGRRSTTTDRGGSGLQAPGSSARRAPPEPDAWSPTGPGGWSLEPGAVRFKYTQVRPLRPRRSRHGVADVEAVRPAAVERLQRSVLHRDPKTSARCRRSTTPSSKRS